MNPNQKESSVSCDSVPCCFHNPPLKLNSERTWKLLGLIQFLFEFFTILEGKKRPNHSSYLPLANGHVRDGNSWNLEITHSFRLQQPFSRGWSCTKETKLKGGCHAVKGMGGGWSTGRFNRDTGDSKPASLPEHLQAIELVVHKIPTLCGIRVDMDILLLTKNHLTPLQHNPPYFGMITTIVPLLRPYFHEISLKRPTGC